MQFTFASRLASPGLPSDYEQGSRMTFFYPIRTQIMDSFPRLQLNAAFYIGETRKGFLENPEYAEMRQRCDEVTPFYHYNNVTDRRAASVQLLVFFSFPQVGAGCVR